MAVLFSLCALAPGLIGRLCFSKATRGGQTVGEPAVGIHVPLCLAGSVADVIFSLAEVKTCCSSRHWVGGKLEAAVAQFTCGNSEPLRARADGLYLDGTGLYVDGTASISTASIPTAHQVGEGW
jgi:hypothetical protein